MIDKKDKSIQDLVSKIKSMFDFSLIEIVDYWEGDICAIGLRKESVLVYISTYNYVNKSVKKYDFDVENLENTNKDTGIIIKSERGVSEKTLMTVLENYFKT